MRTEGILYQKKDSLRSSLIESFKCYLDRECILYEVKEPITSTLNYINENIARPDLSIWELAEIANCSKEHFIRIFTKEVGSTPYQYLLNRRMNVAKNLLYFGYPVKKVSNMVGYNSPKVFSIIYKNKFGENPKQASINKKTLRLLSQN